MRPGMPESSARTSSTASPTAQSRPFLAATSASMPADAASLASSPACTKAQFVSACSLLCTFVATSVSAAGLAIAVVLVGK